MPQSLRTRRFIAPFAVVVALAAAPSTAAAVEWVRVPPEVKPAPWGPAVIEKPKAGSLLLEVGGGYCWGEELPHIDHVRVVERPKTKARPFKSAVITVFKYFPEHELPTEQLSPGEGHLCFEIGGTLSAVVKFKRPLDHLFIYDGSTTPPRRRWPPVGN